MNKTSNWLLVALLAGASAALPARAVGAPAADQRNIEEVIGGWPEKPRLVAHVMIDKYGQPDEITESRLIWKDNGPWKRTIVYREEVKHNWPMPHTDLLEQTLNYKVPPEKFSDLARFDGSVVAERTKGELSARCDKEEANFLALNLAHEVIEGRKSVEEARGFYEKTIQAMLAGKSSDYLQRLRFQPASGSAGDPDEIAFKPTAEQKETMKRQMEQMKKIEEKHKSRGR